MGSVGVLCRRLGTGGGGGPGRIDGPPGDGLPPLPGGAAGTTSRDECSPRRRSERGRFGGSVLDVGMSIDAPHFGHRPRLPPWKSLT